MEWSQDDLIDFALAQEEEEEQERYNPIQNKESYDYGFNETEDYEFYDADELGVSERDPKENNND